MGGDLSLVLTDREVDKALYMMIYACNNMSGMMYLSYFPVVKELMDQLGIAPNCTCDFQAPDEKACSICGEPWKWPE